MNITEHLTLFVVADGPTCRDFYVEHFGFTTTVDLGWYIQLESAGDAPYGLGFMTTGHHSQPRNHDLLTQGTLFVTFIVEDAAAEHERLIAAGLEIDHSLRDEPWGQRHFIVRDPAGLHVDIVEPIPPQPGFLDEVNEAASL